MSRVSVIMLGADADTTVSDFSTQLQLQTLDGKYFFFVNSEDNLKSSPGLDELYNIAETENAGWVRFGSCESAARIDCRRVIRETDTSDADYYMVFSKEQIPDLISPDRTLCEGLYRKELLEGVRWNFETECICSAEDILYWQLAVNASKAVVINRKESRPQQDESALNESPDSQEDIYEVNRKYDFIRDILMDNDDPDTWRTFRRAFIECRLMDYLAVLKNSDAYQRRGFWERFFRETRRSFIMGEFSREELSAEGRGITDILLEYPEDYYEVTADLGDRIRLLTTENEKLKCNEANLNSIIADQRNQIQTLQNRINTLEDSTTFKVGSAVTLLPRHIKDAVRKRHE